MKLLIWLMSLKPQKPRPPGWSTENQETWTPREAVEVRTEIQKQLRRELGKETP